jgi:elongation factor Ts
MVQNIANGRLAKFFKEQTLEEQEYQMADDKRSVNAAMEAVDKDAKVVVFKRCSLSD